MKQKYFKILFSTIILSGLVLKLIFYVIVSSNSQDHQKHKKKLAVIVPFRNAFEELIEFAPKLSRFLVNHKIPFQIFIIHQIDGYRFNRGSLINVGFQFVKNISDYIVIHDVDVYPISPNVSYEYPGEDVVYHIIPYYLHPNTEINYEDYLGSIVAMSNEVYEKVDGISNDYWGE
jgi:xylosylprotein 4-beta-galactosyltransferase